MGFQTINWVEMAGHFGNLLVAYVLALPIGWDREREERSAGIRTFPLVSIASCGFALIALRIVDSTTMGQVVQGLIIGVGFIGGGAILKNAAGTSGTATAAGLWVTGALGTAVGFGLFDIAIVLCVATFLTLRARSPLKRAVHGGDSQTAGHVGKDSATPAPETLPR